MWDIIYTIFKYLKYLSILLYILLKFGIFKSEAICKLIHFGMSKFK